MPKTQPIAEVFSAISDERESLLAILCILLTIHSIQIRTVKLDSQQKMTPPIWVLKIHRSHPLDVSSPAGKEKVLSCDAAEAGCEMPVGRFR